MVRTAFDGSTSERPRNPGAESLGSMIARLRTAAGFRSARDFFNSSGGRPFFRCTYAQYANIEGGRSSPTPGLMEKIAVALRVVVNEDQLRELLSSYLRVVLGSQEFLELVERSLAGPRQAASATPLRQAIQKNIESQRERVTEAQADAMYADPVSYWVSTVLCNDLGDWSAEQLAKLLDYSKTSVAKTLERFEKVGFAVKGKQPGTFRCFAPGKMLMMPHKAFHTEYGEGKEAQRRHEMTSKLIAERSEKAGGLDMRQVYFLRASASALRQYYPYLTQTVYGADIYSTFRPGPDTSLFAVEVAVRKLLRF